MKKRRLVIGTINFYVPEPGWVNIHADASAREIWHPEVGPVAVTHVVDIAEMPFRANEFEEIRAHHVLEHVPRHRTSMAFSECHRVLKRGGILDIEVPDLDRLCRAWLDREHDTAGLLQWFFSEDLPNLPDEHLNAHRGGWNEEMLRADLETFGFDVPEREETGLALRFRAVKR